jgi:hypothetical protein
MFSLVICCSSSLVYLCNWNKDMVFPFASFKSGVWKSELIQPTLSAHRSLVNPAIAQRIV